MLQSTHFVHIWSPCVEGCTAQLEAECHRSTSICTSAGVGEKKLQECQFLSGLVLHEEQRGHTGFPWQWALCQWGLWKTWGFCSFLWPQWYKSAKMVAMFALDPDLPGLHQRQSQRYQDNEEEYTFNMSSNAMCWDIKDLLVDNLDVLATLFSTCQIPKTFTLEKNHNTMVLVTPQNSAMAPPCQSHNPSQAETPQWSHSKQRPVVSEKGRLVCYWNHLCLQYPPCSGQQELYPGQCEPKLKLK